MQVSLLGDSGFRAVNRRQAPNMDDFRAEHAGYVCEVPSEKEVLTGKEFRYTSSSFGWKPRSKKAELFHSDSRFILAQRQTELVGYIMFRFDTEETMEDNGMQEVVYW